MHEPEFPNPTPGYTKVNENRPESISPENTDFFLKHSIKTSPPPQNTEYIITEKTNILYNYKFQIIACS